MYIRLQDDEDPQLTDRIKGARNFLEKEQGHLQRYRGGMPLGFLAAIGHLESSGKMSAVGDPSLGEVGYFMVAENTPKAFGLPADIRKTPEGNIFIAALEYNVEAARIAKEYPVVLPGSRDQWLLARLVFAIGKGGTKKVLSAVKPSNPGNVYQDILAYVAAKGAPAAGSQLASKIVSRIKLSADAWNIGKAVGAMTYGPPEMPPSPGGMAYKIPKDVRDSLKPHTDGGGMLAIAAIIALALI